MTLKLYQRNIIQIKNPFSFCLYFLFWLKLRFHSFFQRKYVQIVCAATKKKKKLHKHLWMWHKVSDKVKQVRKIEYKVPSGRCKNIYWTKMIGGVLISEIIEQIMLLKIEI